MPGRIKDLSTHELVELQAFLHAWVTLFGAGYEYRLTWTNVIAHVKDPKFTQDPEYLDQHPEFPHFAQILHTIMRHRSPTPLLLGAWARGRKNKEVDGLYLVSDDRPRGHSLWWVDDAATWPPSPPPRKPRGRNAVKPTEDDHGSFT